MRNLHHLKIINTIFLPNNDVYYDAIDKRKYRIFHYFFQKLFHFSENEKI